MTEIEVNLERRENLRRLHTATHIINYCSKKILGNHIWQNGSNLKEEFGTLDITHYNNLTREEIFKIENLANEIIFKNKDVKIEELDRVDAENKYGFTLYQGGAIPMKKLRIVHILDSDIEACGGIHMQKTLGIGIIKIISSKKIQDGVVRLKYVVRDFAFKEIYNNENIIEEICKIYSTNKKDIKKVTEKFFEQWKNQKKEIENLKTDIFKVYLGEIENLKADIFKINNEINMKDIIILFTNALKLNEKFTIISKNLIISNIKIDKMYKKKIDKKIFQIYII